MITIDLFAVSRWLEEYWAQLLGLYCAYVFCRSFVQQFSSDLYSSAKKYAAKKKEHNG